MIKNEIAAMSPEQLIERFVRETKLYELSDVSRASEALANKTALAEEILRRGGHSSLQALMGNVDHFVAYSAADHLADLPDFRESALAVLDQIADSNVGAASFRADIARNVLRYGDFRGDPAEHEKRLAIIRARENHA